MYFVKSIAYKQAYFSVKESEVYFCSSYFNLYFLFVFTICTLGRKLLCPMDFPHYCFYFCYEKLAFRAV